MFKSALIALILAAQTLTIVSADAGARGMLFQFNTDAQVSTFQDDAPVSALMRVVQDSSRFPVQPSQAAMAAQAAYPGSVVLGVKLLPGGQYAVTLKVGGSVQRVMVNATSGQVS